LGAGWSGYFRFLALVTSIISLGLRSVGYAKYSFCAQKHLRDMLIVMIDADLIIELFNILTNHYNYSKKHFEKGG